MKKNRSFSAAYPSFGRDEAGQFESRGPECDLRHAKNNEIGHILLLSPFPHNLSGFFSDIKTTEFIPPAVGE